MLISLFIDSSLGHKQAALQGSSNKTSDRRKSIPGSQKQGRGSLALSAKSGNEVRPDDVLSLEDKKDLKEF